MLIWDRLLIRQIVPDSLLCVKHCDRFRWLKTYPNLATALRNCNYVPPLPLTQQHNGMYEVAECVLVFRRFCLRPPQMHSLPFFALLCAA